MRGMRPDSDPHPAVRFVMSRPPNVQNGPGFFDDIEEPDRPTSGYRLIVEADGGSRGNPGPAAYGALVRDAQTSKVLAAEGLPIRRATNNVAEYRGLIAGLEMARELDPTAPLEVRMDSKLVIEQMTGRWKVKARRHEAARPRGGAASAGESDLDLGAAGTQQGRRHFGQSRVGWRSGPTEVRGRPVRLSLMARSARCVSCLAAALFVVARGRKNVSARSSSQRRRAKRDGRLIKAARLSCGHARPQARPATRRARGAGNGLSSYSSNRRSAVGVSCRRRGCRAAGRRRTSPDLDRTDLELITIDPAGSRDLDQALHIARGQRGEFVISYAIADVAAFVRPGDPIDLEAHRRGTTLYAPDCRTPLHPPVLSEGGQLAAE